MGRPLLPICRHSTLNQRHRAPTRLAMEVMRNHRSGWLAELRAKSVARSSDTAHTAIFCANAMRSTRLTRFGDVAEETQVGYYECAGWSSLVARRAHNPKVVSSNLTPATNFSSLDTTAWETPLLSRFPFLPRFGTTYGTKFRRVLPQLACRPH